MTGSSREIMVSIDGITGLALEYYEPAMKDCMLLMNNAVSAMIQSGSREVSLDYETKSVKFSAVVKK